MSDELKKIDTFPDGRASLDDLYREHLQLEEKYGWKKQVVYSIRIETEDGLVEVPVYCFLSPTTGNESLWLLTGIHGEEPAGPNAVMKQIETIGKLGQEIPMVLMPILNPAGYYRNWRFHNIERSSERLNVTDCRHLLPSKSDPTKPIIESPVHEEADKVTKYILETVKQYPPLLFFDLHEDELLAEGYVYSQGALGIHDAVAEKVIELLRTAGVPIKMSGATRFPGEHIVNGLVGDEDGNRIQDGSIDEFIADEKYIDMDGNIRTKPFAKIAIVPETPANGSLSLEERILGQESIIANLAALWRIAR